MSYIRSVSNPEKLYIWADIDGFVYFSEAHHSLLQGNIQDFNNMLRQWDDSWTETGRIEQGDFWLEEKYVPNPAENNALVMKWELGNKNWNGRVIDIYEVTLHYIAQNVVTDQLKQNINNALEIARNCGSIDGDHHKMWVIDQMVRSLLGPDDEYKEWVKKTCKGIHGPNTYEWNEGTAP